MPKKFNPQTKEKEDLKKKLETMLEIFLMNCIIFKRKDIVKKKMVQIHKTERNLTKKIETRW